MPLNHLLEQAFPLSSLRGLKHPMERVHLAKREDAVSSSLQEEKLIIVLNCFDSFQEDRNKVEHSMVPFSSQDKNGYSVSMKGIPVGLILITRVSAG
jgi:hypothetical protein